MTGNCSRCRAVIEEGDLRCAVCAARVPETPTAAPEAARARILRCSECAAAMAFSAEHQAPRCRFCGATMKIEQPVDPPERAELALPFSVERAAAEAALRAWLGKKGWFKPGDLATAATVHGVEPLHWAAWVVEARAEVSWAADSNAGAGRSAWAPHAGATHMDFDGIVVPASRGLSRKECEALAPGYQMSTGAPLGGQADQNVEAFDAQRSAARKIVVEQIALTAATRLERGHIPGNRFRNVKVGVLLEGLRTRRVALPAWVLAYRYGDKPYRAVVHGQDAGYVTGRVPVSTAKVLAAIAIGLAVLALVAFVLWRVTAR
jgi:hypothetical protein